MSPTLSLSEPAAHEFASVAHSSRHMRPRSQCTVALYRPILTPQPFATLSKLLPDCMEHQRYTLKRQCRLVLLLSLPVPHRSLGCLDPQCVLCEHNPHRRCNVNFAPKYLVNDVLKAKCDAPIRVEIIDRQTGVPLGEDIADVHLEVILKDLPGVTQAHFE